MARKARTKTGRARGVVSRRAAMVAVGASATFQLVPLRRLLAARPTAPAARFFSAAELALLDELSEMIIPADEHSPGARAAAVATEIDRHLSQTSPRIPDHRRLRQMWKEGLRDVDRSAQKAHGRAFVATTPDQRTALLTSWASGERKPATAAERFFVELKAATAFAYYTSEIGIHKDMQYKGNSFLDEFQGYDAASVPLKR